MATRKIIENVNPFNEIKMNCFLNALFPAMIHFTRDIEPFLFSEIHCFEYKEVLKLEESRIFLYKYEEVYADLGMSVEPVPVTNENYIETICSLIEEGKPVHSNMDLYYNSLSTGAYEKIHSRHGVLLYGYDKENRIFNIIEHNWVDNFIYGKLTISFEDMARCFASYNEIYNPQYTVFSIYPLTETYQNCTEKYIRLYFKCLDDKNEIIQNSLNAFRRFCIDFEKNVLEDTFCQYHGVLWETSRAINTIINARHFEYASFNRVFGNIHDLKEVLGELISIYNYIRAILYKYLHTKNYRKQSFVNCIEKLHYAYELECQYASILQRLGAEKQCEVN